MWPASGPAWPAERTDSHVAVARHQYPIPRAERTGSHPVPWATSEPAHARHAAAPLRRRTISSDMLLDTVPMGRVRHRRGDTGAVVYAVPDTPPSGLRKFDLGTVPASVTPPRSWRKAALFAVGTSAAVVLGLTVAAVEFMGDPSDVPTIDALPDYPNGPLTLEKLPIQETTSLPGKPHGPTGGPTSARPDTVRHSNVPPDTGTTDRGTPTPTGGRPAAPGTGGDTTDGKPAAGTAAAPTRTTVGQAPVTTTDPQEMGDKTEAYFHAVTEDPATANAMTSGGLAREGETGIESRYAGVERIEVQEMTIDRSQAVTTSTVKVVHEDGTETIEQRQLTFTWGSDSKITDDAVTA
jgi:hypothetical protein